MSELEIFNNLKKITSCVNKDLDHSLFLAAVTKTQSVEKIIEYIKAAEKLDLKKIIIAENYLQEFSNKKELLEKFISANEHIKEKVEFHFIGKIQSNKLSKIMDNFSVIQSIASLNIFSQLEKIIKQKKSKNLEFCPYSFFLQIKLRSDRSKDGLTPTEVIELLPRIFLNPDLNFSGLMTIPPLAASNEEVRKIFKDLYKLREEILIISQQSTYRSLNKENFLLSMGMSSDYQEAIEEGADIIRIGSAIFGERLKK